MVINEVTTHTGIDVIGFTQDITDFDLMTVLAVVVMVYVAFNLFFMLEKFKIKD